MLKKILVVPFFVMGLFLSAQSQDNLMIKFHDAAANTYETENFEMEEISVPAEMREKLPVEIGSKNLFRIKSDGKIIGHAYLGEAPSKKRMFDYAVFFDENLIIKKSKVLIYREDFGRQIGTRRWLSQFDGMAAGAQIEYGKDIAAISGATISATSMTRAINDVLKSIAILRQEGIL